jgi:superfamily II DNA or RNA helicase
MTERRRFNGRERTALYLAADGRCQRCGRELEPGWHGDHVDPHSRGGPTDVVNGQALCSECNLKKGNSVTYTDTFSPRPFQKAVIQSVLDGMASGRDRTVVLASPGSGKTLAYQAVATFAHREGMADLVAVFVPRTILARQCETSWMPAGTPQGNHLLFSPKDRMGPIRHTPNNPPLTPPGRTGLGFVTTYSALVTNPAIYQSWARQHAGRFLLIADEAQFCGAAGEKNSGTRAGTLIAELHEHAAHTLLLTGTPYRSDGQPLILADYDEPDEEGKRSLIAHAEATYSDGISEWYLRRFEGTMHDARVRFKYINNSVNEYDLSVSGADLREVLRKPEVWQPIADGVVEAVRDKQRINSAYRGLISCMEQAEAKSVAAYLRSRHPGVRVSLAISEDGPEAEQVLRDFQHRGGDVLVTVRKAFIGYDCPEITVVGVLTNYRDKGHLMQLVGRGLRMWSGEDARSQSCQVIAPDDPEMQAFIAYMRGESEEGLRERERRENADGGASRTEHDELGYVESAYATHVRALSNDGELDSDELLLIQSVARDSGLPANTNMTALAKFLNEMGVRTAGPRPADPPTVPPPPADVPLTEQEQVDRIKSETSKVIRQRLAADGIRPGDPSYSKAVGRATAAVNSRACSADEARTVGQAQARLDAARELLANA